MNVNLTLVYIDRKMDSSKYSQGIIDKGLVDIISQISFSDNSVILFPG